MWGWDVLYFCMRQCQYRRNYCIDYFQLENTVAEFIGAEAAITVGMGFATNSLNLPRLINKVPIFTTHIKTDFLKYTLGSWYPNCSDTETPFSDSLNEQILSEQGLGFRTVVKICQNKIFCNCSLLFCIYPNRASVSEQLKFVKTKYFLIVHCCSVFGKLKHFEERL